MATAFFALLLALSGACSSAKPVAPAPTTAPPRIPIPTPRPANVAPVLPATAVPVTPTAGRCPQGCTQPPPGCLIKGNISFNNGDKIYHVPGGAFYDATVINPAQGERWFCTEQEAQNNGWRPSRGG